MKLTGPVLAALLVLGCGASPPPAPTFELPSLDAVRQLLSEAIAEAERLSGSATVELPATLAQTLEQNGIDVPAPPRNAREICDALGTPSAGTTAGTVLRALIDGFVGGGEVGVAIGLLTAVVFTTCPIWSPHFETAIDQVL